MLLRVRVIMDVDNTYTDLNREYYRLDQALILILPSYYPHPGRFLKHFRFPY
jgi:hypothetical protein